MMHLKLPFSVLLAGLVFIPPLWANETSSALPVSLCESAQTLDGNGNSVTLFQHLFDDGVYDLAMHVTNDGVKRVTFAGSALAECHYKFIALAQGGEWGWHLSWVSADGMVLNYARMDGVAWVSSPVKKLSKQVKISIQPQFVTLEHQLWVVWGESSGNQNKLYTVHSDDEGRSWGVPQSHTPVMGTWGKLGVEMKEGKAYLLLDDHRQVLPLQD